MEQRRVVKVEEGRVEGGAGRSSKGEDYLLDCANITRDERFSLKHETPRPLDLGVSTLDCG